MRMCVFSLVGCPSCTWSGFCQHPLLKAYFSSPCHHTTAAAMGTLDFLQFCHIVYCVVHNACGKQFGTSSPRKCQTLFNRLPIESLQSEHTHLPSASVSKDDHSAQCSHRSSSAPLSAKVSASLRSFSWQLPKANTPLFLFGNDMSFMHASVSSKGANGGHTIPCCTAPRCRSHAAHDNDELGARAAERCGLPNFSSSLADRFVCMFCFFS